MASTQAFDAARAAFASGRPDAAVRFLQGVVRSDPHWASAQHLLGLGLLALGDLKAAESAMRAAIAADKRQPAVLAALGDVLNRTGRSGEAEKAFRAALMLDRFHLHAAAGLTRLLWAAERAEEALRVIMPLAAAPTAPHYALSLHAEALRRLGRLDEALQVGRRAVASDSPTGEIELAAILRELGRYEEAETAARQAFSKLGPHPAAFLGVARALHDLGRLEEAEAQYREGLKVAEFDPALQQGLAELLLELTGDPGGAAEPLDAALRRNPLPALVALRARLYTRAAEPDRAYAILSDHARRAPDDALLQASAATAAAYAGQMDEALVLAERAHALSPSVGRTTLLVAEAANAAGYPERAAEIAERFLRETPADQNAIALQAVAWRLMGDERYEALYDYKAFVHAFRLPTPNGWPSLEAFLVDLATTLRSMHVARGDPLDQSLRHGTQTRPNLARSTDPVLAAFFEAVKQPLADYVRLIGRGPGPMRSRNRGRAFVKDAWSVQLKPGGFHANHLHPNGWISSAFYVDLPSAMEGRGQEGWLKFGEPGAPTGSRLEPQFVVKPEPGQLVLFPSYMWHGTVPFSGEETRLTLAFDALPER